MVNYLRKATLVVNANLTKSYLRSSVIDGKLSFGFPRTLKVNYNMTIYYTMALVDNANLTNSCLRVSAVDADLVTHGYRQLMQT
jgi:hypothetical protein